MPRIICHHKDRFNLYSTISDTFVFSSSLTLSQLRQYTKEEEGNKGLRSLDEPVNIAISRGTSSTFHHNLDDLMVENRAGQDETHLSTKDCIVRFLS